MSYPSYPGPEPADGFAWADGQSAPAPRLRPLAIAAASLALLVTVVQVLEAVLAGSAQDAYLDAADAGLSSVDVWTAYDTVSLVWLAAIAASYVVTCLWLYQARSTAEVVRPWVHHARGKGWVWGGWLVPIVSLWFPYQVVRDTATKAPDRFGSSKTIGWWWALWIITLVLDQVGPAITTSETIDTSAIDALATVETVNAAASVVTLVLWVSVIRRITRDLETPPAH